MAQLPQSTFDQLAEWGRAWRDIAIAERALRQHAVDAVRQSAVDATTFRNALGNPELTNEQRAHVASEHADSAQLRLTALTVDEPYIGPDPSPEPPSEALSARVGPSGGGGGASVTEVRFGSAPGGKGEGY